jgi:cytochrome c oxidase cbb3-type subunit I/II
LAREGGKYPHSWHYNHMMEPRSTSVGSNMPAYPHLFTDKFDQKTLPRKIAVMVQLGVPYPVMNAVEIKETAIKQGIEIVNTLKNDKIEASPDTKIVALIAYLQKLGKFDTPAVENKMQNAPAAPQLIPGPSNPDKNRSATGAE